MLVGVYNRRTRTWGRVERSTRIDLNEMQVRRETSLEKFHEWRWPENMRAAVKH